MNRKEEKSINVNELLLDFFMWFRQNGERYVGMSIESMIDKYLKENENEQNN